MPKNLDQIFKEGKKNPGKHDSIIQNLALRLEKTQKYNEILICAYYSCGVKGEADLLVRDGNYILNFEVKSNWKKKYTAVSQLKRTERIIKKFFPDYRVMNFYVHGFVNQDPKEYKIEWIRE